MTNRSAIRSAAVAVVAIGSLPLFSASAAAQTCYPPTPGCVTTSSFTPATKPPERVRVVTTTTGGSTTRGGSTFARTGFALGGAAIVGGALVAGGMALKRSGQRRRPTKAA